MKWTILAFKSVIINFTLRKDMHLTFGALDKRNARRKKFWLR